MAQQHAVCDSVRIHASVSAYSMSSKACAHMQFPTSQAQPNAAQTGPDKMQPVTLNFDKTNLPAGDKREPWHPCLYCTALVNESTAWDNYATALQRSIGPCPLIRVSDMLGFEADGNRPGASARLEQFLAGILNKVFLPLAQTAQTRFQTTLLVCFWRKPSASKGKGSQHTQ